MNARSFMLRHDLLIPVVLGGLLTASAPAGNDGDSWPTFRGARGDGVAAASAALDRSDGVGLKVVWKQPLGSGYSAVAVGGGRVVTMYSDGTRDYVAAFDDVGGRRLWQHALGETYRGHDGSHDGPISTPLIADGAVFAIAPRGQFVALDLESGEVRWSGHLVQDHGASKPHYGFTTSPIFDAGSVIVQLGSKDGVVAAFDPRTGGKRWSAGSGRVEYQSPILYTMEGRQQILAALNTKLLGIDPQSGAVLWEYAHGGAGPRGAMSLSAVPAGPGRLFLAHKDDQSTAVRFIAGEGGPHFTTLWEDRAIRNSYNVPVYHDGHVYAFSSRFLICVEAESGAVRWRSRQPGDGFMMMAAGHLILATKEGGLHIAKASPEGYQEMAALPKIFDDLAWCTPAFVNDKIYLRSLTEIARVDLGPPAAVAAGRVQDAAKPVGNTFSRFLADVHAAGDKRAVIDGFLKAHAFPLVEDDWVHFVYRGPGADLAVAGDVIGARQERSMHRVDGTDLFYYSMRVEPDARSNYLFIRDYAEILDPLNSRKTMTRLLTKDMEMSFMGETMEMSWFSMPQWKSPRFLEPAPPARRGRLVTHELDSHILKDGPPPWARKPEDPPPAEGPVKHTVDVYLPQGYDQGTERYPVAYVFDGVGAKQSGALPQALDNLIGSRVQPIIAVFIHKKQPFFGGNPMLFPQMFSQELIPFIDGAYRTHAQPEARACVGSGSSGNTALICAFASRQARKLGLQSAFVMDSMVGMLTGMIQGAAENPMQVYMDWGKYDMRNPHENWDIGDSNRRFADTLREMGYTVAGGEAHDGCGWSSWRNRSDALFETLFPLGG